MTLKDCFAQIIKLPSTRLAFVSLTMSLLRMKATLVNITGLAVRALNPLRPAQFTDHFKAFGVVNQVLDIYHDLILPAISSFVRLAIIGSSVSHLLEIS